jgi:hypothetical protein
MRIGKLILIVFLGGLTAMAIAHDAPAALPCIAVTIWCGVWA